MALTEDHEVVEKAESADVSEFTKALLSEVKLPDRSGKGDFLYAVDHCFVIKGRVFADFFPLNSFAALKRYCLIY